MDSVIYRLSSSAPPGEVNLKPEAWRVLAQVNGVRSLAEIAQAIGLDESGVSRIAVTLYEAGVLEVAAGAVAPPRATIDGAFFDEVAHELARAMGPLAEVVLDNEIDRLGENRTLFPRDRIADLVEGVSEAIPNEAKRVNFQRVMLEAIRKL